MGAPSEARWLLSIWISSPKTHNNQPAAGNTLPGEIHRCRLLRRLPRHASIGPTLCNPSNLLLLAQILSLQHLKCRMHCHVCPPLTGQSLLSSLCLHCETLYYLTKELHFGFRIHFFLRPCLVRICWWWCLPLLERLDHDAPKPIAVKGGITISV